MHYFYREMDFRETEKPTLIKIEFGASESVSQALVSEYSR